MKVVRKVMNAIDKALDVILLVKVGSQQTDLPKKAAASHGPDTGFYEEGFLYMAHEGRAKRLQADQEDRRRRGHDQHYGYNW